MKAFPVITPLQPPTQIRDMQDVWDYFACQSLNPSNPKEGNKEGWRLQYLTKLQSHCGGAPLATIFTSDNLLAEFDANFPKVKKGVHPRPDLPQDVETYKKWRRHCRRTIEVATGTATEKDELRTRRDGWTELKAAIELHSTNGGVVHSSSIGPVVKLSDIARRAEIEPWQLADAGAINQLESAFATPADLQIVRRAQKFLRKHACIPEIGAVLPKEPVPIFPTRRECAALPRHIDVYLMQLVDRAGSKRDEVMGDDSKSVAKTTKTAWLSALRYHVRALPNCPVEPALDYIQPITNLETVNDLASLFAREHLFATLRRTRELEHLPDQISQVSAYNYYTDIMTILWRNNPAVDDFGDPLDQGAPTLITTQTHQAIKNTKFMVEGRELAQGMTKKNQAWCNALVTDKARRTRFRNMHLAMMQAANEILDAARSEGRALTCDEITKARQLGTCAAACAIEFTGRPIRVANVLGLRLYGARRNFFTPTKSQSHYSFVLHADETKSGKDEPETPLNPKMGGSKVLDWYLKVIRPLFPHHKKSIYLFPAVETVGKSLVYKTFDGWFQRAASTAKLPMTFHQWRHGYASLLLQASWTNLPHAAQMLGNTEGICGRNYAWINKEAIILEGQQKTLAAMEADQ